MCSPAAMERLPSAVGWFSAREQFAFDTLRYQPSQSADRFQLGTPSVATVYSGIPGVSMILEAGPERIYARLQSLTRRIIELADAAGIEVASPRVDDERGGVVMLPVADPVSAVEALAAEGIIVDQRPGKVRISPHFYNTEADIDAAMAVLIEASKGGDGLADSHRPERVLHSARRVQEECSSGRAQRERPLRPRRVRVHRFGQATRRYHPTTPRSIERQREGVVESVSLGSGTSAAALSLPWYDRSRRLPFGRRPCGRKGSAPYPRTSGGVPVRSIRGSQIEQRRSARPPSPRR